MFLLEIVLLIHCSKLPLTSLHYGNIACKFSLEVNIAMGFASSYVSHSRTPLYNISTFHSLW